jgi:hypothetical protein
MSMSERAEHATDEMNEAIGPDVDIPGAYPTGSAPTSKEAAETGSHHSEPTDTPRQGGSLGELTKDVSTSEVPTKSGSMGSAMFDDNEERRSDDPPKP